MDKTTRNLITGIALLLTGLSLATAVTLTAPQSARANPGVLYAAPVAQGSGNCSSWTNACTLQTALTNAVSGDEIWVKRGVHYPGAAGNRNATFTLRNGVALYGGFAGTETSRNERNWQTNLTILSGDIDRNDINTDGNYIAETWNDIQGNNAYHVVTGGGTNNTAVLDGFVITAGQANYRGGGMYNDSSSPTLSNLTFSGNTATWDGGGMYNYDNSNPTLTNVTFSGNTALSYHGGGMYNDLSNPTLTNVTFSNNFAGNTGGGMSNESSAPTLTHVTFSGNSAEFGGGMENTSSSPTLTNVIFNNNFADYSGGGMDNTWGSSPTLMNVIFSGNYVTGSDGEGGGMYNGVFGDPTLINTLFYNNSAAYGGGMYNNGSSPELVNVTLSGNSATNQGGGIYNGTHTGYGESSKTTVTNAILWGNNASLGREIYNEGTSTITATYSIIRGGWPGTGNLNANPLFVDAPSGNLRLQPGSPAIDAGNNAAVPAGVTTDLDGNPRFDYTVDMGAYEYQAGPGPRPFGKTSPLNGDAWQPLTLTLSWNASAFANTYAYCYDTINNNACDATWITTSQTSAQISGLSQGITYYWQVRAVNNDGVREANGGDWWSFTTAPSRPGLFSKTSPPDGTARTPFFATLSWSASPGVGQYEYCYDTTNDNACSTWLSAGTATSVTLTGLVQDTTYYWQVRAANAYGTTYADGSSADFWAFTTFHFPGAFNKTSPADGSSLPPNKPVTLSWSASSDVDAYEYCYDTTNDNACSSWVSAGTNTSVTLSGLNPNTTYYWQVRARNAGGITYANGSDTNYWRFSTDRLPGAFNKTSPADASDQRNTVTLSWSASSDADAYEYCYDTTNDNTCSSWTSAITNTSVTLSDLVPGATYYWQVRARNAAGVTYADGSSTAFWSFTTNLVRWSGANASFLTDLARTQWSNFRIRFEYDSGCTGTRRTAETLPVDGPGAISNNQFSFWSSSFSFSGRFTSAIDATGTYDLRSYGVPVVFPGVICIDYVTQSGTWNATRKLLRPSAFGKSGPANGATNQSTTLVLQWNPSLDAAEYQCCVDTADNDTCDTSWVSAGANLSVDLSGLAQNTTYYWQVRASNAVSTTYADNGVWWWFRTVDTTPPTVLSSVRLDPSPTSAESVRFRVTFSEVVTGVDTADFSLSTTGSLSGAAVTGVSGAGSVYTATVSTGTGWGTLRLDIPATATITDLAGNPLSGLPYTGGEAYTVSRGEQYYIFLPLVLRTVP